MFLRKSGSGKTHIILAPGGPCLPGYLGGLSEILSKQNTVLEIDFRDSSRSSSGPPYSMEGFFEDINQALLQCTGPKILLGHSAGALVSLTFATRYSTELDGLILLNPGPITAKGQEAFIHTVEERNRKVNPSYDEQVKDKQEQLYKAPLEQKPQAFLDLMSVYWPAYFTELKTPEQLKFQPVKPEALDPIVDQFNTWTAGSHFTQNLQKVSCPVLMTHSEFDPLPFPDGKEILQKGLSDFSFEEIKGAGHFPWIENPTAIESIVSRWVLTLS